MNKVTNLPSFEGCEALQWQLSELADQPAGLSHIPDDLQRHLDTCEECARFARLWLEGEGEVVSALKAPAAAPPAGLRSAIQQQLVSASGTSNEIAVFPNLPGNSAWRGPLFKAAAAVTFGAFAFWLLKPGIVHQHARHAPQVAMAAPSQAIVHSMAAVERPMEKERDALRSVALRGKDNLRDTIHSSLAIFQ